MDGVIEADAGEPRCLAASGSPLSALARSPVASPHDQAERSLNPRRKEMHLPTPNGPGKYAEVLRRLDAKHEERARPALEQSKAVKERGGSYAEIAEPLAEAAGGNLPQLVRLLHRAGLGPLPAFNARDDFWRMVAKKRLEANRRLRAQFRILARDEVDRLARTSIAKARRRPSSHVQTGHAARRGDNSHQPGSRRSATQQS